MFVGCLGAFGSDTVDPLNTRYIPLHYEIKDFYLTFFILQ